MQGYFTYLLERELNTPGFLKSIRRSSWTLARSASAGVGNPSYY